MKTITFFMALSLIYGTLGASELAVKDNSDSISKSKYMFSVSNLEFANKDKVMPGLTLNVSESSNTNISFEFTCAYALEETNNSSAEITDMQELVLYAQLSYEF